jgi:hypothetical protein
MFHILKAQLVIEGNLNPVVVKNGTAVPVGPRDDNQGSLAAVVPEFSIQPLVACGSPNNWITSPLFALL